VCKGSGLKPEALLYKFEGATLAEIYNSSIDTVYQFFSSLKSSFNKATQILLREITQRLAYLGKVGLGYLTLNRQTTTLSGGELERINLTTALGSGLVNTLFILDEPSIGLHPRDISRLIDIIYTLRNKGNTLVIIEHDPWLISSADWIIDLGPKAGDKGGKIVFQGSYQTLLKKANSLTGKYLRGEKQIAVPLAKRKPNSARVIKVVKARQFNLKNITVSFPLDLFVCVTGVSGSGKSTLVEEVLYRNLKKQKSGTFLKQVGKCEKVIGSELIRDVILVTQSPIGKTPRGNPLTYLKVFAPIRALFAETPLAKTRNYSPSTFSFNSPAGSCETCRGAGFEKVEMQFLADVFLPCPKCDGKRFKEEILEVRYRGKNIQEVLELTVKEAKSFFEGVSSLTNALSVLEEVGLHYLRLGQPLNTLSGGEAQRLKLAHYITNYQEGNILFIFDEPTTGLHLADINILIQAFQNLIRRGNSLIVVEHNLEVIKQADWCIDLGPEGGDRGGKVIAEGKPAELTQIENSYTGKFLKTYLEKKTPTSPRINKISSPPSAQVIELRGAREHNLKNINLTLPRQKLIAITGISGSGKSTLAFDILYAEGQRQYLNCVSSYARQYLKQLSRAEITSLSGLPPTVAIEQRMAPGSTRATVATLTEIYHFLRLLYARVGEEECPECQTKVRSQTKEEILNQILSTFKKETIRLIIPLVRKRKGFYKELLAWIKKKGYQEVRIDGKIYPVSSVPSLARYKEHTLELLLNPLRPSQRNELEQCVSEALALGDGEFSVLSLSSLKEEIYSTKRSCPKCSRSFSKLDPRLFSFNTKLGACPYCEGLGKVEDGEVCPECQGNRLCQRALSVKVKGFSIIELTNFSVERAAKEFPKFSFDPREEIITTPLISEITRRVKFLEKVGLAYLELSRGIDTLSTGELQRVRLAAQLSSELAGVCYILDEPTIGLHPRDSKLLLESLKLLQNKGNTVIVVEHDPWIIQQADYIIDLGPGGGRYGGEVIAEGKPQKIINNKISLTGTYLRKPLVHPFSPRRAVREHWLEIIGAAENNLKNINVKFPLGNFICVTGVSGAGKSSLVREVLYKGLRIKLGKEKLKIKPRFKEIRGGEALARVVLVDQTPIGRTPRSVPATYVGFWNEVRKLFALLPEARVRGYLPGRFSFNTRGGRCEKCQGEGKLKIEMKLLPPVYIPCSGCQGKRYNEETCSIKYKNKSIADVLEMTVEEAADFFKPFPRIAQPLNFLKEIGLDYLTLGQPSPSLSGGEAQRIKLAAELAQPKINTLYILEEPTIGLHTADVKKLIKVIQALVSRGNTVVIVEHNLDVIAEADYIIDLGPEGGARGGEVVAIGSPKEIVKHTSSSYTAQFLKNVLG
jgi:excinuclease ABC subunit A